MSFARTTRWQSALSVALGLIAGGLAFELPTLVLAAVVPVGYVTVSALTSAIPVEEAIELSRTVDHKHAVPGRAVTVTLTVENVSDRPVPEVRVVDGVPADLSVVTGSPKLATGLRAGGSATTSYTVRVQHGTHAFGSAIVETRSLSAASLYTTKIAPTGTDRLVGRTTVDTWPLTRQTIGVAGGQSSNRGGAGVEFFSTRAYRPGDPVSRINWRQYAKGDDLTTVTYRRNEAARVLVVIDARTVTTIAAGVAAPTGLELVVYAAAGAVKELLTTRQRVGLLIVGADRLDRRPEWLTMIGDEVGWVQSGHGTEHRARMEALIDRTGAVARTADEGVPGTVRPSTDRIDSETLKHLFERLEPQTQILCISPLVDDGLTALLTRARTTGHPVTVLAPDPFGASNTGQEIASVQRALRIDDVNTIARTVVDWDPETPLAVALNRTLIAEGTAGTAGIQVAEEGYP